MPKTVFARYITAFMLIIFITFSILGLVLGFNLAHSTIQDKINIVSRTSGTVSEMITMQLPPTSPETARDELLAQSEELCSYLTLMSDYDKNMSIFLIAADGSIIMTDSDTPSEIVKSNLPAEVMSTLLSGEVYMGYDSMDNALSASYLYHGSPVYAADGATVTCAVFACSSSGAVKEVVSGPIKTLIMASLWVFFAALIAVYFITERITSPLKNMRNAAKSFAAGKFDVRVQVTGNDEVSELAAAFNAMAESLQSLENMRNSFLANVSHDLKTPMTTIAGFIDAILVGAIPQEQHTEYLERIKSEVLRLSRLVRQLLDISRVQAGDRKFEFTDFDICEMSRQILFSFEQKITEKSLEVEFDCDEDNMWANADKDAIHQILYNICDNAVKFSREGGLLKLSVHAKERKLHVSVYNEGVGIPAEDLAFVFERFYKSDKSRGLDKSGVGLGLYISKTIINAHGEDIHAESEPGKNCRFVFTLKQADGHKSHKKPDSATKKDG